MNSRRVNSLEAKQFEMQLFNYTLPYESSNYRLKQELNYWNLLIRT